MQVLFSSIVRGFWILLEFFHGEDPSDFTACKQSDDIQLQEAFEELPGERHKVYEQGGPLRHTETMWVLCSQGLTLIRGSWERPFERSAEQAVTDRREWATHSRCLASHWQKVSLHAEDWQKALYARWRSEAFFWGAPSLLPCRETNKTPFTSMMQSHQEVCVFPLSLLARIKRNIALGVLWKQHCLK